jgi:hypothetical protein
MDIKDFTLFAETFAKALTLGSVEELTDEQAGAFIFDQGNLLPCNGNKPCSTGG